jgi:hypothetical protein
MSNRFEDIAEEGANTPPEGTDEAVDAALGGDEEDKTRLNVRVPAPLYERFRDKAESEGRTMTWYVLRWIREYVTE